MNLKNPQQKMKLWKNIKNQKLQYIKRTKNLKQIIQNYTIKMMNLNMDQDTINIILKSILQKKRKNRNLKYQKKLSSFNKNKLLKSISLVKGMMSISYTTKKNIKQLQSKLMKKNQWNIRQNIRWKNQSQSPKQNKHLYNVFMKKKTLPNNNPLMSRSRKHQSIISIIFHKLSITIKKFLTIKKRRLIIKKWRPIILKRKPIIKNRSLIKQNISMKKSMKKRVIGMRKSKRRRV